MGNLPISFLLIVTQMSPLCVGNICLRWRMTNFELTLSCITDNLEHKVTFYDYLNMEQAFCVVSFPAPVCHAYVKASDISQNLTTNETTLVIRGASEGYKTGHWICRHGSNYEEAMTDIKPTRTDIIGLEIRSNQTLPYVDGTIIEMVCVTSLKKNIVKLSWECMPSSILHKQVSGCSSQFLKLTYKASTKDSGRVCKCIADVNGYVSSTSIHIEIRRDAMQLNLKGELNCDSTKSVSLHCSAFGKTSLFGFSPWMHTVNGYFVRHIVGETKGYTLTLLIQSCNYEDSGQYICSLWFNNQEGKTWLNKSSRLIVSGRPRIIKTMTVLKPNVILTATVFSNSYIDSAVWYRLNEKLQNSTELYQKMIRGKITAIFYEVAVEVEGFIVSMKTTNQDFEDTNMNYSLKLRNEFGITTTFFNMSNHQGKHVFDGHLVYWVLFVIAIIVIAAVSISFLIARKYRDLSVAEVRAIYYAAPHDDIEVNVYRTVTLGVNNEDETHHYNEISSSDIESIKDAFEQAH